MAVTINPESDAYLCGLFTALCRSVGRLKRIFTHRDNLMGVTTVALEIETKGGDIRMVKIPLPSEGKLWDEQFFEMAAAKIALEASE